MAKIQNTDNHEFNKIDDELFQSLIHHNPNPIVVFGANGHYLTSNNAYLKLFTNAPPAGYSLFKDPILKKYWSKMKKEITTSELWYNPKEINPGYPELKMFIRTVTFPVIKDGKLRFIVSQMENLTHHKRAEEAKIKAEAMTASKEKLEKEVNRRRNAEKELKKKTRELASKNKELERLNKIALNVEM